MLTCKEFDEFMVDYLGDSLPVWQKFVCWLHAKMCSACAQYVQEYSRAIRLGRQAYESPDDPVPDDVPDELVQAALLHRKSK